MARKKSSTSTVRSPLGTVVTLAFLTTLLACDAPRYMGPSDSGRAHWIPE